LRELCDEINEAVGEPRAFPYSHDVSDYEAIPVRFQALLQDLKRIDLIVYSAGAMPPVGPSEYAFEKDRRMIEVNFMAGVAWLGQAATLFERMGEGHIVGITSVAADRGRVRNPAHNASKAGLDTYLEGLRNRLTRKGVRVLTVRPGFVDTAMLGNAPRTFWVIPPEQAASDIWSAIRAREQIIYTPARWRWAMWVVRNIPSFIFRRLSF
jgi:short-subunit dehydrogenase